MRKLLMIMAAAVAFAACGGPGGAGAGENAGADEARVQTQSEAKKVRMNIIATVNPESIDEVIATMNAMAVASRAEEGCEGYYIYRNTENPNELFIFETWVNDAAHKAHMQTEHFKTLMPTVRDKMKQAAERFEF